MIRTSIVLSPRQNAGERLYLQANGLPVDVTAASQSVVMTSHRSTQLYVASHVSQRQASPTLTTQTGFSGQHMQRLMDLLDRQGSDILARLCRDAELHGEWLVAIDENRLNAVLSNRFQFYLFREQRLRELLPVGELDMPLETPLSRLAMAGPGEPAASVHAPPAGHDNTGAGAPGVDRFSASTEPGGNPPAEPATRPMYHYRIEIRQGDQVMVLPRGIIPLPLLGEAEMILQGMQQLPDRLSSLVVRLRERGVMGPFNGWMAMQVLRTLTEYVVTDKPQRMRFGGWRKGGDADAELGFSEEAVDPDAAGARNSAGGRRGTGRPPKGAAAGVAPIGAAAGAAAGTGVVEGSDATISSAAGGAAAASPSHAARSRSNATGTAPSSGPARKAAGGPAGSGAYSGDRHRYEVMPWYSHPAFRLVLVLVILGVLAGVAYRFLLRPRGTPTATTTTTVATTALPATAATTTARPVATVTPPPTTTATTAPRIAWYVISRRLNVRSEPNSSSKLIRTLTVGQTVYVIEQADKSWSKIQTNEGETGYVFTNYISKNKPAG